MNRQLFMFAEDESIRLGATTAMAGSRDTAKTWCDPSAFSEIVGADFGRGLMHCHALYAGRDRLKIPHRLVLQELSSLSRGTLVVADHAHLGVPQTHRSLAQPFTKEQLAEIYSACREAGVTIRLYPHQHSRLTRVWAATNAPAGFVLSDKTSDINDARALAYYVANCNGISLIKPPESFDRCDKREYGKAVRAASNGVLCAVKTRGYDGQVFPELAATSLDLLRRAKGHGTFINDIAAFSIVSLVAGYANGEFVRFTRRGAVPGYRMWIENVLRFSPCHHRGGVARANINRDRFRSFLSEFALKHGERLKEGHKVIPFGMHTPLQSYIKSQAWAEARSQVHNAYLIATELTADLPAFEPLTEREDVCLA